MKTNDTNSINTSPDANSINTSPYVREIDKTTPPATSDTTCTAPPTGGADTDTDTQSVPPELVNAIADELTELCIANNLLKKLVKWLMASLLNRKG